MSGFRFIVPALPALHELAGRGATILWRRIEARVPIPALRMTLVALGVCAAVAWTTSATVVLARVALSYSDALARAHEALGRQLRTAVPEDTLIALDDCGAVPYLSGLPAVDLLGLTDAFIARHSPVESARYVLEDRRPGLIVLAEREFELPSGQRAGKLRFPIDLAIAKSPAFDERYTPIGVWPFTSFYDLHLYARRDLPGLARLRQAATTSSP